MSRLIGWAPCLAGAALIATLAAAGAAPVGATDPTQTWVKAGPGGAQVADGFDLTKVFSDKGVWYYSFAPEPGSASFLAISRVDDPETWETVTTIVRMTPGTHGRLKATKVLALDRLRDPDLWSDDIDLEDAAIGAAAPNGALPISVSPGGDIFLGASASVDGRSVDGTLVHRGADGSLQKVLSSADLLAADIFGKPADYPSLGVAAVADDELYGRVEAWTATGDSLERLVRILDPNSDGDWSDRVIRPIVLPDPVPTVADGVYDWSYGGFVPLSAEEGSADPADPASVLLPFIGNSEYRVYRLTDAGDDGAFTEPGEVELVFSSQVAPGSLDAMMPPQLATVTSPSGPALSFVGLTNPSRVSIAEDGVARDVVRGLFAPSGLVALADGSTLIGNAEETSGGPAQQPYSIHRLAADAASAAGPTDATPSVPALVSPGRKIIPRAPLTPDVPRVAVWLWAMSKDGKDAEMLLLYGADGSGPRDVLPGVQEVGSWPCQSADATAVATWAEVDVPNEHALYLFDSSGAERPVMVTERSGTIYCPFPEGVMAFTEEPADAREPVVTMSRLTVGGDAEPAGLAQTRHGLCSAVTSDGRFLAVPTADGTGLSVVDVVGGTVRPVAEGLDGTVVRSAWTPDGSRLAIVTGPYDPMQPDTAVTGTFDVSVVDVSAATPAVGTSPRKVFSLEGPSPQVSWSPDGRSLAVLGRDQEAVCGCERAGVLTIVDTDTGATRTVAPDASFAEWSPADPLILAWGDRGRLTIETDGVARVVEPATVKTDDGRKPASWSGFMGWSPDGRYLLFGDQRLLTVDTTNDQARVILSESDDLALISTEWWR